MPKYLGEAPVDVATHPEFKSLTPADWATLFITKFGGIDGAHHKDWVLDQVARILNGTPVAVTQAKWDDGQCEYRFVTGKPGKAYLEWRESLKDAETGEDYYDEGIAP